MGEGRGKEGGKGEETRRQGDTEMESPNRRNIRLHQTSKHCVGLPVMSLLGGRGFRCNKPICDHTETDGKSSTDAFNQLSGNIYPSSFICLKSIAFLSAK